jgi:uncharacterized protein
MDQAIQDFLQGKRFAVVGVSRSGKKFGNTIYKELKERGYQVFIVHPEAQEIEGEPCHPNLSALKGQIEGVLVNVPPAQAVQVVRDAAAAGLKKVWLQQGAESAEVLAVARELGIHPVSGKCILMYASPVRSVHSWHRAFAKLFGQY